MKYELPIKVVVFNNYKLGLIQMEQEVLGYPEYQTGLHNPNFAKFAELCGGQGIKVTDPAEIGPTLREAFGSIDIKRQQMMRGCDYDNLLN